MPTATQILIFLVVAIIGFVLYLLGRRRSPKPSTHSESLRLPEEKNEHARRVRLFASATKNSVVTEPRGDAPFPTLWCFVSADEKGIIVKRYVNGEYAGPEEFIAWRDVVKRGMEPSHLHFIRRDGVDSVA